MDDSKGSVTHEICGIKAYEELSTLEEPSNSTKVLKKITEKVYANEVNLSRNYLPSVKRLG